MNGRELLEYLEGLPDHQLDLEIFLRDVHVVDAKIAPYPLSAIGSTPSHAIVLHSTFPAPPRWKRSTSGAPGRSKKP